MYGLCIYEIDFLGFPCKEGIIFMIVINKIFWEKKIVR